MCCLSAFLGGKGGYILSGMYDLEMAVLRNNALVLNFASNLGKAHQKYRRPNLDLVLGRRNQTAMLSGEKSVQ
jgi:hypothetical protein